MIHRWANKFLLENIRFIWQIINIRFRDIFCEIFRFATETFRLRRIGYIKYYITFSKYPEYLRSKPRRKFLNETENQYKEINEKFNNEPRIHSDPYLYKMLQKKYLLGAPNDISYLCMTFLLHIVSSILSYYS